MENRIEQLEKYIEIREQEIEELQNRIDKAINILETKSEKQYGFNYEYNLNDKEIEELLDILKGE